MLVVSVALLWTQQQLHAYEGMEPEGIVSGRVVDASSNAPIAHAAVAIAGATVVVYTDSLGVFTINVGHYGSVTLSVSALGYYKETVPYVVVTPTGPKWVLVAMHDAATSNSIEVTAAGDIPRNIGWDLTLHSEEILRSPGSVNDLNRALMISPMITSVEDASNDLIIRGGSPTEVGYYVDGIYLQNISHLPQFGGNGGLITFLNMDFVQRADVEVGSMRASAGNALSGMVSIEQSNGSADALHGQVDLNATGFSANLQGPLSSSTTFFATARQSYVDALVALLNVGNAPQFRDAQFKVHQQFQNHDLSVTGLYAKSDFNRSVEGAKEDLFPTFGQERYEQYILGARLRDTWSENLTSTTSAGMHSANYDYTWYGISDSTLHDKVNGISDVFNLRHATAFQFSQHYNMTVGTELRLLKHNLSDTLASYAVTQSIAALFTEAEYRADWIGAYLGFRFQWYSGDVEKSMDQRFTFWVAPFQNFVISTSVASVSQPVPFFLSVKSATPLNKVMRSSNMEVQFKWTPSEGNRVQLTSYLKDYRDMPASASMPFTFLLDEVSGTNKTFTALPDVTNAGSARTYGAELSYGKTLDDDWMMNIGVSYFRSEYYGAAERRISRSFNNRVIGIAQVMWIPANDLTVSSRLSVTGGRPYVPIDAAASAVAGTEVLNRPLTNTVQLPTYVSLSIRADKRWYYQSSTLTAYLSIMNVLNNQNVKGYVWNAQTNSIQPNYMWGIIPVFGVEFDW